MLRDFISRFWSKFCTHVTWHFWYPTLTVQNEQWSEQSRVLSPSDSEVGEWGPCCPSHTAPTNCSTLDKMGPRVSQKGQSPHCQHHSTSIAQACPSKSKVPLTQHWQDSFPDRQLERDTALGSMWGEELLNQQASTSTWPDGALNAPWRTLKVCVLLRTTQTLEGTYIHFNYMS